MRFGGLIIAIVLAAVAAVVVLRMSGTKEESQTVAAPAQVNTTNIYVAKEVIPIGTTMTNEMVEVQPWPSNLVLDGFVQADGEQKIAGMVTRSAFQSKEPILMTKLSNPNDPNFLAGALPKGMRVVTITTNETEGVAGFVFPGDYVDVILTHQIEKYVKRPDNTTISAQNDEVTETLITNVKVLAVDQRASGSNATDSNGNLLIPRSVSLMVSPSDAQRLRLAQQKGTLTLALRSLADRESADPLTATTEKDISQFTTLDASKDAGAQTEGEVTVIRGVTREGDTPPPGAAAGGMMPGLLPTMGAPAQMPTPTP